MTAEEIFNMFFGGGETTPSKNCLDSATKKNTILTIKFFLFSAGFPSQSVYVRRGRNQAHFQRHYHTNNAATGGQNDVREVYIYASMFIWSSFKKL